LKTKEDFLGIRLAVERVERAASSIGWLATVATTASRRSRGERSAEYHTRPPRLGSLQPRTGYRGQRLVLVEFLGKLFSSSDMRVTPMIVRAISPVRASASRAPSTAPSRQPKTATPEQPGSPLHDGSW